MKHINKKYFKIFLSLAIFFALAAPTYVVFADTIGEYVQLAPLPGIGTATTGGQFVAPSLPNYLIGMFRLLIGLAGLLAVVMITLGGIEYMSTDSMFGKEEGKSKISQALVGLLLAISAWLILSTVNPATLEFNFNPEPPAPIDPGTIPPTIEPSVIYKNRVCLMPQNATPPGRQITYTGRSFASMYECMNTTPIPNINRPERPCLTTMYSCEANRAPDAPQP